MPDAAQASKIDEQYWPDSGTLIVASLVLVEPNYPWREQYEAAIVETKFEKLFPLVREAKAAIDARLHELQMDHGGTPEERHAISDALAGLNSLRREIETRSHDKV